MRVESQRRTVEGVERHNHTRRKFHGVSSASVPNLAGWEVRARPVDIEAQLIHLTTTTDPVSCISPMAASLLRRATLFPMVTVIPGSTRLLPLTLSVPCSPKPSISHLPLQQPRQVLSPLPPPAHPILPIPDLRFQNRLMPLVQTLKRSHPAQL